MRRLWLMLGLIFVLAQLAAAQTKVSGTNRCAKPDPQHSVQVGDRPSHTFAINQTKCTWPKPMEIAGVQSKEGIATAFSEISGDSARVRIGYYSETMANGDKVHFRYQGRTTLKDGVPQSDEGTWSLARGTGKLKGIKGKGTYKGTPGSDGSMSYEVVGEYNLPK